MIISVVNEKGGSGKTSIALNLSAKLHSLDKDLLLIDADPQNSTRVFNDIRACKEIPLSFPSASILGNSLASQIKSLSEKYDYLIVDTGGRDSEDTRLAISLSDILIIPTIPSDLDIAVLNKMLRLFTHTKLFNTKLKAFVVISKASPNPFLHAKLRDLQEYINEKNIEDCILSSSVLYEREAYRSSFSNGLSIFEYCKKTDKAYQDFEGFFEELIDCIDKEKMSVAL
ncbi:chromosome partitioning protein ParA [Campylobacter sp. MIT 97-5078]|nr:chromosome partitioning protein ParA [Campylobacter sp. MIT 97-5078]TQR27272.1 chromosome partitioning protein ParA [Campylobacter sp. MIT 97-5078]